MGRILLTDKFLAGVKYKPGESNEYTDSQVRGLKFRVSGIRAEGIQPPLPLPARRYPGAPIARYLPGTSLAVARSRCLEAENILADRQEPRLVLAENASGAMTVRDLIASYVEKHARPNMRSHAELERRLRKNVEAIIGNVRLADLHRRDCTRAVDAVMRRGRPVEACRVFEDTRAMLRWAVARGDLDRNPMEGMRRPAEQTPRDRVLDDDEVRTIWHALPNGAHPQRNRSRDPSPLSRNRPAGRRDRRHGAWRAKPPGRDLDHSGDAHQEWGRARRAIERPRPGHHPRSNRRRAGGFAVHLPRTARTHDRDGRGQDLEAGG